MSGWFGSGKSHFLKFLGAILADLPLTLPSGAQVSAASYLCGKWNLPFEAHLAELQTRVVFVNLLGYVSGETPGLSKIVYQGLMTDSGYADEPWLAEMERFLARRGLYDRFREEVEAAAGLPWAEVRTQPGPAVDFMAQALTTIDPGTWPSAAEAERMIERQGRITLNPNWLAARLKEEAERIHPDTGRLVVLLDEVGLYIGNYPDRYLELKAIAENLSGAEIFAKAWLIATSQEAPEQKIQEVVARREELEWLRDRFPLKFALTPENIETVVRERLLKKSKDGAASVRTAAAPAIGALSLGAAISGARRNREIFEVPEPEQLAATYPLLPYQIRLTTEILGQLRGHGAGSEGLTGRERAILAVAQWTLCTTGLAQEEIGPLVTLEHIYDAIVGDTRVVPGAHEAEIRELASLGFRGDVSVQSVAKALYLLQQVPEWVPATVQDLAAVLYPRLDARGEDTVAGVREALAELVDRHYVGEREGVFRFLAPVERTFEEDVERARRNLTAAQRRRLANEVLRDLLSNFTRLRFHGGARVLDVQLGVDGEVVNARGHLRLVVHSPLRAENTDTDGIERGESLRARETAWWVTEQSGDLADMVDRVLAMEAVLGRPEAAGEEGAKFRAERERDKETLRHTTLPTRLRDALSRGMLIAAGTRRTPEPGSWEQAIRTAIEERAEEIFYEFSGGAVVVRDEEVGRILTWRGGGLPECYRTLGVLEDGAIREDCALLSRLLEELKRRAVEHESLRGSDLADHFDRPPYGWDERVIRLGLASLLRNGSIEVRTPQGTFRRSADTGAARALTNRPAFREASFHPAQVLMENERREARDLAAEWFSAIKETPDEIDEAVRRGLDDARHEASRLATRLSDFRLGGTETMRDLASRGAEILDLATPASRLLAVLEPSARQQIGSALALLKALKSWEQGGGFEKTSEIQGFLTAAREADPEAARQLAAMLTSDDLPGAWPGLYQGFQAALASHANAYRDAHAEVCTRVASGLAELERHPRAADARDELAGLRALGCGEPAPDVHMPPFRCFTCGRGLVDLQRDGLRATSLRSEILRKLQAAQVVREDAQGVLEPFEAQETVTAPEQVESLNAALAAYAERGLRKGAIEIQIRATPKSEGTAD